MELKRLSFKHKNSKILYYVLNYTRRLIPNSLFRNSLKGKLESISPEKKSVLLKRVNYYNKLQNSTDLSSEARPLNSIKLKDTPKAYFFDLLEYSRYFRQTLKGHFQFGDITEVPEEPSFVKSRPISDSNENSVLLKWNKIRHFNFIHNDPLEFKNKQNLLVGRSKVHPTQPHRIKFLEKYFNHPLCNIGKVNGNELNSEWIVDRMTISEQLQYKFILCLEGNDVASNLKWVMSSNSIAVMPKPKFETWFMEGTLLGDHHYIEIKGDYSDLEERLAFFMKHPEESQKIINNAHQFVTQFQHKKDEDLISLMVMEKYFKMTKQEI